MLELITGSLGGIASGVLGFFKNRDDHKHEVEMAKLEGQQRIEENKAEFNTAKLNAEVEGVKADAELLRSAYRAQAEAFKFVSKDSPAFVQYLAGITTCIVSLMRPLLSVGVLIAMIHISGTASVAEPLSSAFLTMVSFWFASRSVSKHFGETK